MAMSHHQEKRVYNSQYITSKRRRHRRIPVSLDIHAPHYGDDLVGMTIDVSYSGAFVWLEREIPERQLVSISLSLPGDREPMTILGMVTRHVHTQGRDGVAAMGIVFYANASEVMKRWGAFVTEATRRFDENAPPLLHKANEAISRVEDVVAHSVGQELLYFEGFEGLVRFIERDFLEGSIRIDPSTPRRLHERVDLVLVHPLDDSRHKLDGCGHIYRS